MSVSQSVPCNFSWVVEGKLAAMGWPSTVSNIRFLYALGIRHLVTLSPEMRPPIGDEIFQSIKWYEIAVEEFCAPTMHQMAEFVRICEEAAMKSEAVGVHCRQGRGRTGVMAACYLMKFCGQTPSDAFCNLRRMRPGSIETYEQQSALWQFRDFKQ